MAQPDGERHCQGACRPCLAGNLFHQTCMFTHIRGTQPGRLAMPRKPSKQVTPGWWRGWGRGIRGRRRREPHRGRRLLPLWSENATEACSHWLSPVAPSWPSAALTHRRLVVPLPPSCRQSVHLVRIDGMLYKVCTINAVTLRSVPDYQIHKPRCWEGAWSLCASCVHARYARLQMCGNGRVGRQLLLRCKLIAIRSATAT